MSESVYTEEEVTSWRETIRRKDQAMKELGSTIETMRKYNDELLTQHLALVAEMNVLRWRM